MSAGLYSITDVRTVGFRPKGSLIATATHFRWNTFWTATNAVCAIAAAYLRKDVAEKSIWICLSVKTRKQVA